MMWFGLLPPKPCSTKVGRMASDIPLSLELGWHNRQAQRPFPRTHTVRSAAGVIIGSAPVAAGGEEKRWNPQELLLAAVAQSHLLTFLALAEQAGLTVTEYKDEPSALADESNQLTGRLNQIRLSPKVWLADPTQRELSDDLHQQAQQVNGLLAALNVPVLVEPSCPPDQRQLPEFTSRLGAPIAILKPTSSLPPSQVTGRPGEQAQSQAQQDANPVTMRESAEVDPNSFFAQVGGHPTFKHLVDVFYEGVADDPLLRPMYPEEDLGPAKIRLQLFLEQYWGGPKTYSEHRGHPRLRMRHRPYPIDFEARDRWLHHMRTAVDALELSQLHESTLWDYLERAAHSLVNAPSH